MKIIDAQVHIWSQTVVPTSGLHRKVSRFSAEELLSEMDEAGVDAAPIHPPLGWDPNANALAVEAARTYPDRFAVMGLRWSMLLAEHQKRLHDGSLDTLWPALEREGLPVAMMGGLFLDKFREIAERHPRLRMMVDHCGL